MIVEVQRIVFTELGEVMTILGFLRNPKLNVIREVITCFKF